jgi:L-glyceraldehyde 3-phosphate reductase
MQPSKIWPNNNYLEEECMYEPKPSRYKEMKYNTCGKSGLKLPAVSLGLWHNFGDTTPLSNAREMIHTAFDLGITHFDLANNYGPPPGSAELNFGKILAEDLAVYRDELIISSKAGYYMWPGPYGEWGSRKYVLASLDQSLKRTGLDYFDIFYSHRFDPNTPLEETMSALETAYRQGKALYVGISSYSAKDTRRAYEILQARNIPVLIHQPSYSMLNRWIEADLLETLDELGIGTICFSPLAQGMLSDKYLKGVPSGSRAATVGTALSKKMLTKENLQRIEQLNAIAQRRGQSLAQMALAWVLRRKEVTSVLIGASSSQQIIENVGALANLAFNAEELQEIDSYAQDGNINLWAQSSS